MFQLANHIEAAFWIAIGLGLGLFDLLKRRSFSRPLWIAVPAFVLFGVSDIVEANTGAWWDPWWLLLWKTACLAILLCCFVKFRRSRKTNG